MDEHQGSADCMVTKEKVSWGSDNRQEGVLVAGTLEHMGDPFPLPSPRETYLTALYKAT